MKEGAAGGRSGPAAASSPLPRRRVAGCRLLGALLGIGGQLAEEVIVVLILRPAVKRQVGHEEHGEAEEGDDVRVNAKDLEGAEPPPPPPAATTATPTSEESPNGGS